ncbi:beta-ketoacyl synthase [Phytohalomonas tamaricis]|uniref:beta-ketoacyl synthase n=1 Tax=Phytohalomonas tamaricis TaxID=2081032 RepID=UPI000D0B4014|nr:beta-ketoacyl synthase [Phytohalomonas tamaricis]
MGGVNAAGRTSGHQSYRRTVIDALSGHHEQETLLGLASLMRLAHRDENGQWHDQEGKTWEAADLVSHYREYILKHTLIRRNELPHFNEAGITANRQATLALEVPLTFTLRRRHLPEHPPEQWQIRDIDTRHVEVTVPAGSLDALLPERREPLVHAAAQLPTGFEPNQFYHSVHHPRALSMTIFGASDCIGQSGFDWQTLSDRLDPDQIAVYAGNSIGQFDQEGWAGLMQSYISGNRATSKQMPLGYSQMPADFLNAYVLGSVGSTGALQGACATFLYNLRLAVDDIKSGRCRLAMVGTSDAPITPEIIEGFRVMSALADDNSLKALDALELLTDEHYQRACRPFAHNCGFTMAEATQFVMVMDDSLALETGADILGSVPEVFVNADGWKRSISAPGIGNYFTLGKSVSLARAILGDDRVRQRSYVHAHGTSTPKNRTTESHVLDAVARANGIKSWPVAAIKAYLGHSQGSAAGDQIMNALGTFHHGLIPGIFTLDAVAEDVFAERLDFFREHREFEADVAFINSKGFGGNNSSAPLLSPQVTEQLLTQRHGEKAMTAWRKRREKTRENAAHYEAQSLSGHFAPVYRFGHNVLEGPELDVTADAITIPGYAKPMSLKVTNPFGTLT